MEDMKKMIERYKKELIEYSKSSASAEKSTVFEPSASEIEKTQRKKPRVIGYISDDAQKELENIKGSEKLIENLNADIFDTDDFSGSDKSALKDEKNPENSDENIPENNGEKNPANGDENIPDTAVPPSEDNETITYDVLENSPRPETEESGAGFVVRETVTPSEPQFTTIPSFDETRETITNESVPEENVATKGVSGVTDNSARTPRAEYGNNETVSEEKAERLTEQPISGTNENEQLTGRSFEDGRTPQNNPNDALQTNGSKSDISNFDKPDFAGIEQFERENRGKGTILFRVYTAREALPLENAVCTVTKTFGTVVHTFYTLLTDSSGKTSTEPLPAPSRELSQQSGNTIQPFSLYDAVITRDGFADVELRDIPVFDGVSSVQQVGMVPIAQNNSTRKEDTDA